MSDENTDDQKQEDSKMPSIDPADFAKLQESVAKLEAKNKELLAEKQKAAEDARRAAEEAAKKSGDVEALERSWGEKLAAEVAEREAKLNEYRSMVGSLTVGTAATKLAADVFGQNADIMLPHIQARLSLETADGKPRVRILDAAGNPSAASLEELAAEFRSNPKFAPLVIASRATGGGAHSNGGGAAPMKKFAEMSGDELKKLRADNPGEYDRLRAEHYGSA